VPREEPARMERVRLREHLTQDDDLRPRRDSHREHPARRPAWREDGAEEEARREKERRGGG
jgi:hypothetical protein